MRFNGSTIGSLSYVLSNIAAALGGVCMRAEEIGPVYALVKGAGGLAVDHANKDIGERVFNHGDTYSVLAGCPNIIEFVQRQINK